MAGQIQDARIANDACRMDLQSAKHMSRRRPGGVEPLPLSRSRVLKTQPRTAWDQAGLVCIMRALWYCSCKARLRLGCSG